MKRLTQLVTAALIVVILMPACKPKEQISAVKGKPVLAVAPVIIYKTKANYIMHVPVSMSPDKKSLTSYPAPGDVYYNGDLAYPIELEGGYFLDKRGIDVNTAFTKWTYYEYSRLPKTPTEQEILNMLLETDPLLELYDMGKRNDYKDLEEELNTIIRNGDLKKYKKLK